MKPKSVTFPVTLEIDNPVLEVIRRQGERLAEVEHYVSQLLNIPSDNALLREEVVRLKTAILEHERCTKELFSEDITALEYKLWAAIKTPRTDPAHTGEPGGLNDYNEDKP